MGLRCPSCSATIVVREGETVVAAGSVTVIDVADKQADVIREQAAIIATQSDRIEQLTRKQ